MIDKQTYAWDFIFAEGETIKEKYGSLYDMVSTLSLSAVGTEPATVVCTKDIGSMLSVYADMNMMRKKEIEFIPKYEEIDDRLTFVGEIKHNCGSNGYKTDFLLYEDKEHTKDEISIALGNRLKIIKIFNYPFAEEDE